MKNIEVEVRSFITPKECRRLRGVFDKNGRFLGEDFDETVYFKAPKDLRIRRDGKLSYLILKEGRIHDGCRKEIEIKLPKQEFKNLEELLTSLGFKVEIRWYRTRRAYKWKGVSTYLWVTKGYGYVIELEKMSNEQQKEEVHKKLIKLLKSLNVKITPREEFEKKLSYYKKHWPRLTRSGPKKPRLPT